MTRAKKSVSWIFSVEIHIKLQREDDQLHKITDITLLISNVGLVAEMSFWTACFRCIKFSTLRLGRFFPKQSDIRKNRYEIRLKLYKKNFIHIRDLSI